MNETQMLNMTATTAARRGVGFLTSEAQARPVKVTSHGKPIAVVLSAAEYDAQRKALRETELKVLSIFVDRVADRFDMIELDEA